MLYSHASIFQKWPKPAQLNILSLGVPMISMFLIVRYLATYRFTVINDVVPASNSNYKPLLGKTSLTGIRFGLVWFNLYQSN